MRSVNNPHTEIKNNQVIQDRLYRKSGENKPPKPVNRDQQQRFMAVALSALGIQKPPTEPRTQAERVLWRIAKGQGGPVELPDIQLVHPVVSQMTARIFNLREHGFTISNRTDLSSIPCKSWYWLELNPDGTPKLRGVEFTEPKDGKTKNAVPSATPTPAPEERKPATGTGMLFPDAQPVKAWADHEQQAQGGQR